MFDEASFIAPRERIRCHESFRETDHAELEAPADLNARGRAERDFDAAAADVDDYRRARSDVDRVGRRHVNQARLLRAGNDADANADISLHGGEKVAGVFCFANGARRGRDDLIDAVDVGQAPELGEGLQGGVQRGRWEIAPIEAAGAQAHHVFLAVDDFEREIRTKTNDDHVDGIRPDIDRRNAHGLHCLYTCVYVNWSMLSR